MGNDRLLHVGAPMWKLPQWNDRYYGKAKPGDELRYYSSWCTAVEGNTTFYAVPSEASVERWAEMSPDDFQFCFKVPRRITHDRRLRAAEKELAEFCVRMEPLGARLGPLWIQLPASFGPHDLPVLDQFLSMASANFAWAVELRHLDFEAEGPAERAVNDLLHRHGADRIHLDSRALFDGPRETPEEIDAWGKKPRLRIRPVALSDRPTVRFIGQTRADANPPYWQQWVHKVAQWIAEGRRPLVFIHTPDNAVSPELNRQFYNEVAVELADSSGLALPELPSPQRVEDAQMGLDL